MLIKEGFKFTSNSKDIICTKSTKINLFNYVPEGVTSPLEKINIDSNNPSYNGYSKIINAYLPLLEGYDLRNDKELSKEEIMMLSLIMLGSNGLLNMIEDNMPKPEVEYINTLVDMLSMMEKDSINGKEDVCLLIVNSLDEIK